MDQTWYAIESEKQSMDSSLTIPNITLEPTETFTMWAVIYWPEAVRDYAEGIGDYTCDVEFHFLDQFIAQTSDEMIPPRLND
jgi:hypothetical protein